MRVTLRVLSARVHQPLINFPGKRSWPSTPAAPHAHPAAPPEFQKRYSDVAKASTSSSSETKGKSGGNVVSEFWEAPERFWRPRMRQLEESEIDAILSGGASLR